MTAAYCRASRANACVDSPGTSLGKLINVYSYLLRKITGTEQFGQADDLCPALCGSLDTCKCRFEVLIRVRPDLHLDE